jgi:pimeloyl-ACP methyl ester carboxylesterase
MPKPISRRSALGFAALAVGTTAAAPTPATPRIVAEDHWAQKGPVRLYIYRKHNPAGPKAPVVFLCHGSSFSGRGGFDLTVPGQPSYSMMDWFVARGFDVWTVDHEGYGRSTRTGAYSDVESGAADLRAAFDYVSKATGQTAFNVYAQSGGALRAGSLAVKEPQWFRRMAIDGFSYTGDGPEIMRRRANVETYRKQAYRQADQALYDGIFSRDDPSTVDPGVPKALGAYELALGDRVPNGLYLDMATKLPIIQPETLKVPVQLIRAEIDGNASNAELIEFFGRLPSQDKQMAFVSGVAHVAVLGKQREKVFHLMHGFFTYPMG